MTKLQVEVLKVQLYKNTLVQMAQNLLQMLQMGSKLTKRNKTVFCYQS